MFVLTRCDDIKRTGKHLIRRPLQLRTDADVLVQTITSNLKLNPLQRPPNAALSFQKTFQCELKGRLAGENESKNRINSKQMSLICNQVHPLTYSGLGGKIFHGNKVFIWHVFGRGHQQGDGGEVVQDGGGSHLASGVVTS